MAARKGGSFQGPLTKEGSFRKTKSTKRARKSRSKAKKPMMLKTTQRALPIVCNTVNKTGMTLQLDKMLSQANSKLYRQGMNYHARISLVSEGTQNNDTEFKIYTLPKDHRTIGALRMARSIYNQAMKDELEIRPQVKSAWTDFKIQPVDGASVTWAPMLYHALLLNWRVHGADLGGVEAYGISDNYNSSEITANDGDQRKFALVTDTSGYPDTAWNVFIEYQNFLLNRADPDSAAEVAAYGDASPVLTEMAELADKGDEPPYSWGNKITETIGGVEHDRLCSLVLAGTISAGPTSAQQRYEFVDVEAPLGLVWIETSGNYISTTVPELLVNIRAGNYKGVKADRIYSKDKLLGF